MLRRQLIAGMDEVLTAIHKSELILALRRGASKETPAKLLRALRNYALSASRYNEAARQVASVFEIEKVEDPDFWVLLLGDTDENMLLRNRLNFVTKELPQVLSLLTQDTVSDQSASKDAELSSLQIRLIEENGRFSTVSRVIQALSACQELYDSLATLEDDVSQPLAVAAIDSGSDKAFDLFGAAKVMSELRQLILSMWDLVVFHRERKLGRQLELIASALPILERIQKLEDSQKLGREQAQIIRNGIIDGTKRFLDSGVTLDEFSNHSHTDPRMLLAPEQKLLSGPSNPPTGSSSANPSAPNTPPSSDRSFSPEEQLPRSGLSDDDIRRIAEALGRNNPSGPQKGSIE